MRRNGWGWFAVLASVALVITPAYAAGEIQCPRPELKWHSWRDHVLASNPGTDLFELRGDGRDELLRAYSCLEASEKCPPDRLMVFHCTGNKSVLIAFVKDGCVTAAEDISIEDYLGYVTGGAPC